MDVPVSKALAGCMVAAGVVGLLAVIRVLSVILGIVPDSIKLAVVSTAGCIEMDCVLQQAWCSSLVLVVGHPPLACSAEQSGLQSSV